MVDLVKIRKKAKEKKESEEAATAPDSPDKQEANEQRAPAKPKEKASPRDSAPDKRTKPGARPKSKPAKQPQPEVSEPTPVPAELGTLEQASEPEAIEQREQGLTEVTPELPEDLEPAPEVEAVGAGTSALEDEPSQPVHDSRSIDRLAKFKQEAGRRRSWTTDAAKSEAVATDEEESHELELLRFKLAGEEYAVDIENIVEIVPPRGTTRVPNADGAIVGIMSLRGTIVTVFDLRSKLGHPPVSEEPGIDPRMIVVEREGETAGFLVDRVSRVVKLDPSELENHPVVSAAEQSDYVDGVFQSTDGLVILLDLEKILTSQN